MFGISFAELAVVVIVALLLFGPEKLPEIARSLGQIFSQLRRSTDQLREEFYGEISAPSRDLRDVSDKIKNHVRIIAEDLTSLSEQPSNLPEQPSNLPEQPSNLPEPKPKPDKAEPRHD